MKTAIFCWIVAAVVLAGIPVRAQEPLVLYDSFQTKFLDPSKWAGDEYSIPEGLLLESSRRISGRSLSIMNRGYGATDSNIDGSSTSTRLIVRDGRGVETIEVTIQVKELETVGCDDSGVVTTARARISGYFFNTTGDPPSIPGSAVNDVLAYISVGRSSDSSDPADVLTIDGRARRCLDDDCMEIEPLGPNVNLGKVHLNKRVRLRLSWDKINHKFIFQRGSEPEYTIPYTVSDTFRPNGPYGGNKKLDVQSIVPNCTTQPRPVGYMEVFFDNVFVNESAIP